MDIFYRIDTYQRLKTLLAERQKISIIEPELKPSAVLLPVYYQNGQHYILFTRRTELVHHHKGEISFPGGGYHPDDSTLLNTALRESYEEIGLGPADVEVLGELDDTVTKGSNYIITPFIGFIKPDYQFIPSNFEIAEIISIPIAALLGEECRREDPVLILSGRPFIPYIYTYQNKMIIGATARILKQFLDFFSQVNQ